MAKKDNEQQTMEEYLLSQLDTPVVLKDGTMMTGTGPSSPLYARGRLTQGLRHCCVIPFLLNTNYTN